MIKVTYVARPLNDNGLERTGTLGTIMGQYRSSDTFRRYAFNRYGRFGETYRIYRVDGGHWTLIDTWRKTVR